jgi:hypothetical protein
MRKIYTVYVICILSTVMHTGCDFLLGNKSPGEGSAEIPAKSLTWISGSTTRDAQGIYGEKGKAAATNVPGARKFSVSWIDSEGNFWLFGGAGVYPRGHSSSCNDLWRYKPSEQHMRLENEFTGNGQSEEVVSEISKLISLLPAGISQGDGNRKRLNE